jgi:mRNA (guanine-N7-)-methyltransferase
MKDSSLDGFIFVNQSKDYKDPPLKWKPEKLNTIDFKIIKNLTDNSFEEWTLLCSEDTPFTFNGKDLSKVKVDKSVGCNYTNGTIVEFYYDKVQSIFVPLKTRYDKIKGNYIKVAQDNFDTIINPCDLKIFCKPISRNQSALFNMRRFHNWIKRKLLEKYSVKTGNLLDLACGKGGDIYKWVDNNIRQVQGYDIDNDSITEAKRRFAKVISKPTSKAFDYKFEVRDLSKDPCTSETLYDTVSCFFAIHYFYKDNNTLKTFTESLKNVKEGGYFIMTTLSSEKLKEIDYTLKNEHVEIMKKSIDPKKTLGNIVSVFIKDSVLDIPTEEYIVDYDYTIKFMAENSFKLVETKLFDEYYKDWKQNQNFMSSQEIEYSFLNRVYIFVRTNTVVSSNTSVSEDTLLLNRPLKGKNEWKLAELKKYCSENNLDTRGKKEQLFERIKQHLN